MVDIRKMRVLVHHANVAVPMLMRLIIVPIEIVRMPVVLIMDMTMGMLDWLMPVLMFMVFRQVQPDAPGHQRRRQPKCRRS